MARVRYQQTAQIGNQRLQVERDENCFEDWLWSRVKFWGFIIGSIAVFYFVFWLGGGRFSAPPATPPVVYVPVRPTGGGGKRSAVPTPPSVPTVIKVEPIKVEVVNPLPPPALPSAKSGLPPNVW